MCRKCFFNGWNISHLTVYQVHFLLLNSNSDLNIHRLAALPQLLPVYLLPSDSLNENGQKLRTGAEVKDQILHHLLVWYYLIEDNDPHNPLQHKINSSRAAHSPVRLWAEPPSGSGSWHQTRWLFLKKNPRNAAVAVEPSKSKPTKDLICICIYIEILNYHSSYYVTVAEVHGGAIISNIHFQEAAHSTV